MRWWIALGALLLAAMPPACSLDCDGTRWSSRAPNGGDSLVACARPMLVAMPGQGSDAPANLVLRDGAGWIRGVISVGMLNSLDLPPEWVGASVRVPLHAEFPRPRPVSKAVGFLVDRSWRWRTLLGLTRSDDEFR